MSNLTRKAGIPQMRCRAVPGGKRAYLFPYEVNVLGSWVPSNYPFAAWVVENSRLLRTVGIREVTSGK